VSLTIVPNKVRGHTNPLSLQLCPRAATLREPSDMMTSHSFTIDREVTFIPKRSGPGYFAQIEKSRCLIDASNDQCLAQSDHSLLITESLLVFDQPRLYASIVVHKVFDLTKHFRKLTQH
jgi:hypothetical protein